MLFASAILSIPGSIPFPESPMQKHSMATIVQNIPTTWTLLILSLSRCAVTLLGSSAGISEKVFLKCEKSAFVAKEESELLCRSNFSIPFWEQNLVLPLCLIGYGGNMHTTTLHKDILEILVWIKRGNCMNQKGKRWKIVFLQLKEEYWGNCISHVQNVHSFWFVSFQISGWT